jgi:uncharacterized protein YeaO (DUF488 family)
MDNIKEKIEEFQLNLDVALASFVDSLQKERTALDKMQEDIKNQNMQQVKTSHDLSAWQEITKKFEAELKDRESQILIKERALSLMQETLTSEKDKILKKERELNERDIEVGKQEKQLEVDQAQLKRDHDAVEEQRILNQEEKSLDGIRKAKLSRKEAEIQSQLERVKTMST